MTPRNIAIDAIAVLGLQFWKPSLLPLFSVYWLEGLAGLVMGAPSCPPTPEDWALSLVFITYGSGQADGKYLGSSIPGGWLNLVPQSPR